MIQPIFDEGQATPFGYQDFHLLAAEDGETPEEHVRRNERAIRAWLAQADAQGWVPTGLSFAGPRRLAFAFSRQEALAPAPLAVSFEWKVASEDPDAPPGDHVNEDELLAFLKTRLLVGSLLPAGIARRGEADYFFLFHQVE